VSQPLTAPVLGSPEWWLRRLHRELADRIPALDLLDDYYRGEHPLPWLAPQAHAEFRRILRMTRSNYMGLVCDAMVERMSIEGFRLPGEDQADEDTWRLWQANDLDGDSDKGLLEAAIGGTAYTLVEPNGTDTPNIYIEHGTQAIIGYVPGSNRRKKAAGLKLWVDDWTGALCATVDVKTTDGAWLYKFETDKPKGEVRIENLQWRRRQVAGESWPARNTLGEVALTELPNNPRLRTGGVSEISDVLDAQDRVNKTIADRLMTQDFGAFPALFASGYPDDEDDQPVQIGRDRMITTDVAETKWWQMTPAPLDPYSAAKQQDVHDIAARTRTPAQYLLGEMSNVNGETLKASESGLVSKVRQRMRSFSEGFEETMRLARQAAGLASPDEIETIWRNPEFRTEAEVSDAAVKQLAAGIRDLRSAREFVGLSQAEIAQMEAREEAAAADPTLQAIARDLINASAPTAPPTGAPGGTPAVGG